MGTFGLTVLYILGGHHYYWVKPKSFWVQKDWLDGVVVNCIYLCDFSKSTELLT